ncbi:MULTISPECIES: pilus assembly protein CpaE [unclassified Achromobacter]|uniref:pilus assembly protein CpaE n=1 Tax=unclassified Achromobacter TaxID=2626865 RepID=UPI000B5158A1|nr:MULTISPECIES: pilus assembly protein CpaE [unclassified Achromobacter]OWT77546.1 pilus assembly protein CpaE [Achromobacter sp. HZ28]OWT78426.1 pilus assembly protein CpaE [Achromobacter sp. HZ34]
MSNMKTHSKEWIAAQQAGSFLFCSNDSNVATQLSNAIGDMGLLMQELPSIENMARRLAELDPRVVFLDFTRSENEPGKLLQAADLARMLARVAPAVPRVAVGYVAHPEGAIAALRAGVSDFVDPSVAPDEVREVVQRVMHMDGGMAAAVGRGARRSVALLGARPGVGTSTLAVHLAGLMQDRMVQINASRPGAPKVGKGQQDGSGLPLSERVGLLDLGWPVGDCLLYLNIESDFDFAEAVRNLRRLDPTLLGSAMAHTRSGISVLSMPRDVEQMRGISLSDSLLLFERMRQHYGLLLADAGGFSNAEFVAGLARSAQETWLVTDQSVGALVSLAGLLRELDQQHVDRSHLRLVVNRYDERYGMTAAQIAERFNLELAGTVPDRTLPLMVCTNQGHLLHEDAERDVYVRAVQHLADRLTAEYVAPGSRSGWLSTWLPGVQRRMSVIGD